MFCGATNNFINQKLAKELELSFTKTLKYGVVIGNKNEINDRGVCQAVVITLLRLVVTANLSPIDLGRMDVILGMQWLCTTEFMGFIGRC